MIDNENDFLGFLISKCDDNNKCDPSECERSCDLDTESFLIYMRKLNSLGYISQPNLETIIITDYGKSHYVSSKDKMKSTINNSSKRFLKIIVRIIIDIIVGVAIAYISFRLGLQQPK
mgnify:CR=1 FL=1